MLAWMDVLCLGNLAQYRTLLHYMVSLAQQSARSILQLPEELDALASASRLDLASMDVMLTEVDMQVPIAYRKATVARANWLCVRTAIS